MFGMDLKNIIMKVSTMQLRAAEEMYPGITVQQVLDNLPSTNNTQVSVGFTKTELQTINILESGITLKKVLDNLHPSKDPSFHKALSSLKASDVSMVSKYPRVKALIDNIKGKSAIVANATKRVIESNANIENVKYMTSVDREAEKLMDEINKSNEEFAKFDHNKEAIAYIDGVGDDHMAEALKACESIDEMQ